MDKRSQDPQDYQHCAAPVTVLAKDFAQGETGVLHSHPRAQLIHAIAGTMRVSTANSTWIIPPQRALWIAPGVPHVTSHLDAVSMRTAYVVAERNPFAPNQCHVLAMTPLMRHLLLRLLEEPRDYVPEGAALHAAHLFLLELPRLRRLSITLPLPQDARLRRFCEQVLAQPEIEADLDQAASETGTSQRTLQRLFHRQLGMSFGRWRQQMKLIKASAMLAQGERVSVVARRLNYRSPSAFSAMFRKAHGVSPSDFIAGG